MIAFLLAFLPASLPVTPPMPGDEFSFVHGGLYMRVESTDDDKVWMTHTGGVIRCSTDGGASFTNSVLPTSVRGTLRGIQISSDGTGPYAYCVGADGTLLFSVDDGASWTLKPTVNNRFGAPANLWDVFFTDRLHGWIVGFENLVYETFDGGTSWTDISHMGDHADMNQEWYQIEALADDEWIAVADHGWVYRRLPNGTRDSFVISLDDQCYSPTGQGIDLELWSVDFTGSTGLIGAGVGNNDGYVFKSTNRGATWNLHTACYDHLEGQADRTAPAFYGVEMFDDPTGGAVAGYSSAVYLTGLSGTSTALPGCPSCPTNSLALTQVVNDTDQNQTVEPTDDGRGEPLQRDISASDSNLVAWTVGDQGTVRRSDDQGATWFDLGSKHGSRIRGGEFDDPLNGLVFGQQWRALATSDGGEQFTLEYEPNIPIDPNSITANNPGGNEYNGGFLDAAITPGLAAAVVVGERGRIAVRDDMGNWTDRSIGSWSSSTTLTGVLMGSDASGILITGPSGVVYLSGDNGATFSSNPLMMGGQAITANLLDADVKGQFLYYLASDNNVYVAQKIKPLRALVAMPLVGSTGAPTVLTVKTNLKMYAGNASGQIFRLDPLALQFDLVTEITPADLGGTVEDIEFVPGSPEWFFSGDLGTIQRYDGSAVWTPIKSTIELEVRSLEMFSPTEGLVIGRKINIAKW